MPFKDVLGSRPAEAEDHWISISDLMAGLMVLFLFIAISYMKDVFLDKKKMEDVAITFQTTQQLIYKSLFREFRNDLPRWGAKIDQPTLTISFREPSVFFDSNSADIKFEFKKILNDFFPRYLRVLDEFKDSIEEVRIEGHTSSEWHTAVTKDQAYFNNMRLSQDRTRAVLHYVMMFPEIASYKSWAKKTITANGLSSSKLIMVNGEEMRDQSRRVDFRVRTDAEVQIRKILSR